MPLYMKMSQNINKTTRHLIFRIYKEKKSIGILENGNKNYQSYQRT